jgi:hypothetical protein
MKQMYFAFICSTCSTKDCVRCGLEMGLFVQSEMLRTNNGNLEDK